MTPLRLCQPPMSVLLPDWHSVYTKNTWDICSGTTHSSSIAKVSSLHAFENAFLVCFSGSLVRSSLDKWPTKYVPALPSQILIWRWQCGLKLLTAYWNHQWWAILTFRKAPKQINKKEVPFPSPNLFVIALLIYTVVIQIAYFKSVLYKLYNGFRSMKSLNNQIWTKWFKWINV